MCVCFFPPDVPVCVCKFDRKPRRCGAMRNSTAFCRAEMYSDLSIPSLETPASTPGQNAHTHTEIIVNIAALHVFRDKRWRQNGKNKKYRCCTLTSFFLRIKQVNYVKRTNICCCLLTFMQYTGRAKCYIILCI